VRDPLARFRSEYLWRHRRDPVLEPAAVEEWGRRLLERYAEDLFVRDNHIRPQSEFLLPGARVHRYEDGLQSAVDDLSAVADLPPLPQVAPAPSAGGHRSADVPLTEALERLLREFYVEDFKRFGYA
jgi:hypothetical protein